jgi:hypothetical protein
MAAAIASMIAAVHSAATVTAVHTSAMHAATMEAATSPAMAADMAAMTTPHEGGENRRHCGRGVIRRDRRRSGGVRESKNRCCGGGDQAPLVRIHVLSILCHFVFSSEVS